MLKIFSQILNKITNILLTRKTFSALNKFNITFEINDLQKDLYIEIRNI